MDETLRLAGEFLSQPEMLAVYGTLLIGALTQKQRLALELRAHYRDGQDNPVFKRRDDLVSRGIPHWYTGFDDLIQKKIDQLNKRWEERGGKMPPRNGNGKNGHH